MRFKLFEYLSGLITFRTLRCPGNEKHTMKHTRLLLIIFMLFSVCLQAYSQKKKEESSVIGQVNGFLSKHVKLTAYGQFGYSYTDKKNWGVRQADNQFFGRLGMLILSGDVTDKLSWMVQYELFISQLLELYACYRPYPFFQIKAGQMKTCFTLENQMSPSVYETVNFSRVIERLAGFSGDVCGNQGGRDIGLQVGGELVKTSFNDYFLEYRFGVYNGSGLSMKDKNDAKDFAAWFTLQPVKGLKMGASAYWGKLNYDYTVINAQTGEESIRNANMKRNRVALSACYQNHRLTCRGEYLWGKDDDINRRGFYALGHWFAVPSRLALVAKLERYEANTAVSDSEMIYTLGGAYHITAKTRVMLNYAHFDYKQGASVNELWAMLQIGF